MASSDYGGNAPKRINPTSGQAGRALEIHPQGSADNMNNSTLRFCSGNSGNIQRRIIRHLLEMIDSGLDHMSPPDRLKLTGTTAIRGAAHPYLNPLDAISTLRRLNGHDCILTIPLPELRISEHGRAPGCYSISPSFRQKWREALQRPQHATGAGEVQP